MEKVIVLTFDPRILADEEVLTIPNFPNEIVSNQGKIL
jgi:hypothetical protein